MLVLIVLFVLFCVFLALLIRPRATLVTLGLLVTLVVWGTYGLLWHWPRQGPPQPYTSYSPYSTSSHCAPGYRENLFDNDDGPYDCEPIVAKRSDPPTAPSPAVPSSAATGVPLIRYEADGTPYIEWGGVQMTGNAERASGTPTPEGQALKALAPVEPSPLAQSPP